MENGATAGETARQLLRKHTVTIDSAIPLLGTHPGEMKTCPHTELSVNVQQHCLSEPEGGTQPTCPSTDQNKTG